MTINERAIHLIKLIQPEAWQRETRTAKGSLGDRPILDLTDKLADIDQIAWDLDEFGNRVAVYLYENDKKIGINEEKFGLFQSFIDEVIAMPFFVNLLSKEFIEDKTFDWIIRFYRTNTVTDQYEEYLTKEMASNVNTFKYFFPICNFEIEKSFKIGNVEFNWIRKEQIEYWNHEIVKARKDEVVPENYIYDLLRKHDIGPGTVYAQISIEAESKLATEFALNFVNSAINCLKLFGDTILHPKHISNFGINSMIEFNKTSAYLYEKVSNDFQLSMVIQNRAGSTKFSIDRIEYLVDNVFPYLSRCLDSFRITTLGQLILQNINRIGVALSKDDIYERILILCSAIESIFVPEDQEKDMTRTARSNLCWYLFDDMKKRNLQMEICKGVYDVRHKYIHKARKIKINYNYLANFQMTIADALFQLIEESNLYTSKEQLIEVIEKRKLRN
ncbi:MAG: hypothetical protein WBP41_05055 [Saprospiraceae bacterium]